MTPEHLAQLWEAWDARPGNDADAVARCDAVVAYVGVDEAGAFQRHVTTARRYGLSLVAAIYSWGPQ